MKRRGRLLKIFKILLSFLGVFRFNTTFKLHQKATQLKWYKRWHDFKFAQHFHVFVFVLYLLGVIAGFIAPATPMALAANGSWTQTSFAGTGDGTYSSTVPYNTNGDVGLDGVGNLSNANSGKWQYRRPITVTNPVGNGALTDYQVKVEPFTDSNFVNNTGLIGSWHFNEGSGATTADTSGASINSASFGGASYWTASGKYGPAYSANGANSVNLGSFAYPDNLTFASWMKFNTPSTAAWVMGGGDSGGWNTTADIYMADATHLRYGCAGTTGGAYKTWSFTVPAFNSTDWYHVVFTQAGVGGTPQLFVNGLEYINPTVSGSAPASRSQNQPYVLGKLGAAGTGSFNGAFDEFRMYNRVITSTEVSNLYNSGTPKVRSDYQDLRFTKADGTELPYWQETDGRYWIKYSGTLNTGDTTIYMYYGNAGATFGGSYANTGDNTFKFFDNFDGAALDTNKWTANAAGSITGTVANGVYRVTAGTTSSNTYWIYDNTDSANQHQAKNLASADNVTVEWQGKTENTGDMSEVGLGLVDNSNLIRSYMGYNEGAGGNGAASVARYWQYETSYGNEVATNNETKTFRMDRSGTTTKYFVEGTQKATGTLSGSPTKLSIAVGTYAGYAFMPVTIDKVRVRTFAATDLNLPTLGSETAAYITSGTFTSSAVPTTVAHQGKVYGWGNFTFANTLNSQTITYDILDSATGNPINGYTGITTSPTDLSGISSTTYPALKVRANFSGSGSASPLLNSWDIAYSYDIAGPTVPSGLTAGTVTATTIPISWTASTDSDSGVAGYEVQRAPDSAGNPGTWVAAGGTCTGTVVGVSCTDSGLTANTKYWFRVRAKDNIGNYGGYTGENTVVLQPDGTAGKDTTLSNIAQENNAGVATNMHAGVNNTYLVSFDLSSIPAGSTIYGSTLSVYETVRATTTTVSTYRNLRSWNEGDKADAAATDGEPDWLHQSHSTSLWASGGARGSGTDRAAVASATDATFDATVSHFHNWSGSGMVADVQAWVDGTATNNGWLLYGDGAYTRFLSSETATAAQRPKLTITYGTNTSVTTLPTVPVLDTPAAATNDTRPVITNSSTPDSGLANSIVNLYDGATKVGTTKANGSGVFTFGDNKLLNSSFETDGNADGLADNWNFGNSITGTPVKTLVDGNFDGLKAQRVQYTGIVTDSPSKQLNIVSDKTAVGSYAAGGTATGSVYLKGVVSGAVIQLQTNAYDSTNNFLGQSFFNVTPTTNWTKYSVSYSNLPANTSKVAFTVSCQAIDNGDTLDFQIDNAKLDNYNQNLTETVHNSITAKSSNGSTESAASNAVSTTVDITNPIITSFSINSNAAFTSSTNSTLSLSATDTGGTGVYQMQFSNDGQTWSDWEAFNATKTWALTTGDGTKVVNVRVKDTAGNITTYTTTPTANAAADWQAKTQGNHYGNFYDSVSGTWATVARAGSKTIYDPLTKRIYDVPANYLGVNPRSDGKPGSEAIIEESRVNSLTDSSFELDSNANGISDSWYSPIASPMTITLDSSLSSESVHGSKSQRLVLGGTATNNNLKVLTTTNVMSYAAGENVTFSVYAKGNYSNCQPYLQLDAINGSGQYIGSVNANMNVSNTYQRFSVTYSNLPANTARVIGHLRSMNYDTGDVFDLTYDAAQIEKGSFATSYIPTTTTSVTRNADNVTVPTTSWNRYSGTIFAVQNTPAPSSTYTVNWNDGSTNNRIYVGLNIGTKGWIAGTTGGVTANTLGAAAPTGYATIAGKWTTGQSLYAYTNGAPSSASATAYNPPVGLVGSANIGSQLSINSSVNVTNGPIQRVIVYGSALSDSEVTTVTNLIKDGAGSINLDTTAPIASASLVISPNGNEKFKGGSSQNITWNPLVIYDEGSGLAANPIKLEYTTNGTDYTLIAQNEANDGSYTWTVPAIDFATVKIRVSGYDAIGNSIPATDVSDADFMIDSTGPVGTVLINSGDQYANAAVVNLSLSATDGGSGIYQMQFSNDGISYTAWEAYSASKTWDLTDILYGGTDTDEIKTVYVKYSDNVGNISLPISDGVSFDKTNPSNAATVTAKSIPSAPSPDINSSEWSRHLNPTFEWSGAADDAAGIKDHYVYFGSDQNAEPRAITDSTNIFYTDNGNNNLTTSSSYTVTSALTSGQYYLKIRSRDNALNDADPVYVEGQNLFVFMIDTEKPAKINYIKTTPAGFSVTDNYSFEWEPVTDANSGLNKYIYRKMDGADTWHDLAPVPEPTSGKMLLQNITHYKDDVNKIEIRAVDNTGNESDSSEGIYYFAGNIAAPENVRIDLSESQNQTVNRFSISWDKPTGVTPQGYYYSINAAPTPTNSIFVPYNGDNTTTIGPASFATVRGLNTVQVVTKANDLIGWANPSSPAVFTCNTAAPGIPTNVMITDSSNRESQRWQLTINWDQPSQVTPDFSGYIVERSSDGVNYSELANTSKNTTGYLDTNLVGGENQSPAITYYYRIFAKDSTGNKSAASTVVSKIPTGKYVTPPDIIGEPKIDIQATKATVTWTTSREADSFVQIGTTDKYGMTQGQLDSTSTHKVNLLGLTPGTTYHYRAMWRDIDSNIGYSKDYIFKTQDAPGISEVTVSDIRLNSAIISWKSTTISTSKVLFGKSTSYGSIAEDQSSSSVTVHVIKLDNLDHTNTYHFKITSVDVDGNVVSSDDYVFDTLTFPKISNIKFEQMKSMSTSTIQASWDSNIPVNSVIEYFEGNSRTAHEVSKSALTTKHILQVPNLKDNTQYRLVVKGRDAYGNEAASEYFNYKTDFDTRPPEISEISTETSIVGYGIEAKAQIIVSWFTDEPATSQVEYSEGVTGDNYSMQTQEDGALSTSHVVVISDLKPSSSYYFRVKSKDFSKNEAKTSANSVLTEQARSSILDIIVKSFENTLGWLFGGRI